MKSILVLIVSIYSATTLAGISKGSQTSTDECQQLIEQNQEDCEEIAEDQAEQDEERAEDAAELGKEQAKEQTQTQEQKQSQGKYDQVETVHWINFGEYKVSKSEPADIILDLNGSNVSEIKLQSFNGDAQVNSASILLSNGRIVNLSSNINGLISDQMRVRLNSPGPVFVDKIKMNISATKHHIFSKRTRVGVMVGLIN